MDEVGTAASSPFFFDCPRCLFSYPYQTYYLRGDHIKQYIPFISNVLFAS